MSRSGKTASARRQKPVASGPTSESRTKIGELPIAIPPTIRAVIARRCALVGAGLAAVVCDILKLKVVPKSFCCPRNARTQLKSDCRLWTELVVEKVEHISFTIHVLNIVLHVAKEWERRKFCPRHCYDAGLLIPLWERRPALDYRRNRKFHHVSVQQIVNSMKKSALKGRFFNYQRE